MLKNLITNQKEFSFLPAELQEFLVDLEILNKLNEICRTFELGEKENQLKDIVVSVIKGEINLHDIPGEIEKRLKIDFDEALNIDGELYSELFSGIEDLLDAQYSVYINSTEIAPQPKVEERDVEERVEEKREHHPLIEKAIKKFSLSFSDENLKTRFFEIADSFLSGARTKIQFRNTLVKDVASGGLGWEKENCNAIAEFLASYLRIQDLEKSKKGKETEVKSKKTPFVIPAEAGIPPLTPPLITRGEKDMAPPPLSFDHELTAEWEKEGEGGFIKHDRPDFVSEEKEAIRQKTKIKNFNNPEVSGDIGKKINDAMAELNLSFPSSELNGRLKGIIDARLRNVRTSVQTQEKLIADVASGGMGLAKEEANEVSLVLNKYLDVENKDLFENKMSEKDKFEKQELAGKEEREKMEKDNILQNLNMRFKKLTGKDIPLPEVKEEAVAPAVIPAQAGIQTDRDSRLRGNDKLQEAKPVTKFSLPQEEAPFVIAKKTVVPSSAPPLSANVKPSMDDIKFTPKLYGPLEEIGRMNVDDFRKLSVDPNEVMLKVKDKLALLRSESFKKYQQGIDAWHKSPVYAEYLKILSKSLSANIALTDLFKTEQTLTQQEFDAIMNTRIGD